MDLVKKIVNAVRVAAVIVTSQIYLGLVFVGGHCILSDSCKLVQVPMFLMISAFANFCYQPWREAQFELLKNPSLTAKFRIRTSASNQGINFCLALCGSVVVFGQFSTWNYQDTSAETYCELTSFMLAFVLVVHQWILVTIFLAKVIGFYTWAFWTFQQILMLK